jgi:uncharacterized membrane protein
MFKLILSSREKFGFQFLKKISKRLPNYLILSVIIYATIFSAITILRIRALQTYAYDLGNYHQALYTTLTGQGFLYYTSDLLANPSGSIFGVHVAISLLEILPLYSLLPKIESLLIIQSIMISLGAIPVFLLANLKLNSKKLALFFALAFLLNPAIQGINWYDFHPEAFILLPFLFAIYFSEVKSWKLYFISIIFVLFSIDKSAMLVGAFALFKILQLKIFKNYKRSNFFSRTNINYLEIKPLLFYIVTFFGALVWFIVTTKIVLSFNPFNLYTSGATQYWNRLGARNLMEIPQQLILHPDLAVHALVFDLEQKILYVLILFGPVLFLPLISPKTLIMYLPWLAIALFSSYPPYYQFGTQYPAYIIPVIFYGSVIGANKIRSWFPKTLKHQRKYLSNVILVATLSFFVISSPLMPWCVGGYPLNQYGFPQVPSQARWVNDFIEIVPKNASILVQNNIFPLVSDRATAFVTPTSVFYPSNHSFTTTLSNMLTEMDYILLDFKSSIIDSAIILSNKIINEEFGLLAFADGVFLLKRGYTKTPLIFEGFCETYDFKDLILLNGTLQNDPRSKSPAIMGKSGNNEDFWYGPYKYLPPGKYQAIYRMKINQKIVGEILTLKVRSFVSEVHGQVLGNNSTGYHIIFSLKETEIKKEHGTRKIFGEDFIPNDYTDFVIDFDVETLGAFEFIGVAINSTTEIYLDQIEVKQIETSYTFTSLMNITQH